MHNRHFIKVPIGWKIRDFIDAIEKKLNLQITAQNRIEILKKKGLKVGINVIIDKDALIDNNYCHLISIGDNSVICGGVMILAHDSTIHGFTRGHGRIAKVEIKENCIISVNSIILPGVTIGPNVLVAAGSVVNKDIPSDSCVVGVPARFYGKFSDYIANHKEKIANDYVFKRIENIENYEEFIKEKKKMIEEAQKREIYYKI
jgi:maltose O-acetyltransferase